jgi:crotonobetainyl-CoA:carnitine CoA-transferase CaiB-like acyl-CoA transferase
MALGALEPQFWKAFCEAVGRNGWNQPSYFEPGPHQETLTREVATLFREKTRAEWATLLEGVDCCCEPVMSLAEVMDDPEAKARGMVVNLVHESWGAYRQLGIAPKFSRTPGAIRSHAPELGEHTQQILQDLGFAPDRIGELRERGVT